MNVGRQDRILTMNRGSATLKATLYELDRGPNLVLSLDVDRAGESGSHIRIADSRRSTLFDHQFEQRDPNAALEVIVKWLGEHGYLSRLAAAGHRLVHGGSQYTAPRRITPVFLAELEQLVPLDPDHLPGSIHLSTIRRSRGQRDGCGSP